MRSSIKRHSIAHQEGTGERFAVLRKAPKEHIDVPESSGSSDRFFVEIAFDALVFVELDALIPVQATISVQLTTLLQRWAQSVKIQSRLKIGPLIGQSVKTPVHGILAQSVKIDVSES